MPYLKLYTNVEIDNPNKSSLLNELSELVANETGKPESYVMIGIDGGQTMLFAGKSDPLAYLECKSIGLSSNQSQKLSASLCQLVSNRLNIAKARIYIEFSNCPSEYWGWNGSTFG